MFVRYRTLGFVFKKEERGEADQVFKIFTKDFGKIEVLGKGIRKISSKLRSQIDIFCLSEIEFVQGKLQKRLTDALLIEKFKTLRQNLQKLSIAYQICEVLNKLIKGEEKDERIWNLILETFKSLNEKRQNQKLDSLKYYYFFWNLVAILGEKPELYQCCICQGKLKPEKIYFSPKEGGIICSLCFEKIKNGKTISQNVVKILRTMTEKDLNFLQRLKFPENGLKELQEITNFYSNFLTENETEII